MLNDRELKIVVGGRAVDRPSYPEYLENPAAEEAVIQVLVDQGHVPRLLGQQNLHENGHSCTEIWCERDWPCVWWERATEAQRRAEEKATETPDES